jgi:hypothetical protein
LGSGSILFMLFLVYCCYCVWMCECVKVVFYFPSIVYIIFSTDQWYQIWQKKREAGSTPAAVWLFYWSGGKRDLYLLRNCYCCYYYVHGFFLSPFFLMP